MRCVFDTNVLVSALLLPDSKPRRAVELALEKGRALLSFAAFAELYEVLGRKNSYATWMRKIFEAFSRP
ncbi:MAG: PIN domain-containing protein [Candidatus Acidiferrales bacterium]